MNPNEIYYKKVMTSIGCALLIFLLLINLYGVLSAVLPLFFYQIPSWYVAYSILCGIIDAVLYLAAFLLPALFLRLLLKGQRLPVSPMRLGICTTPYLPLIILSGISICFAAAQLNAVMVEIFNYSEFSSQVLWESMWDMEPYEILLQFVTVSIVPGFCEEILFRGAILTACLPFGRSRAIIISSVLFALMHQNAEQIFYTFVAGVILGIVYERTGSIWSCILLHVCNNFVSVIETAVFSKMGATDAGTLTVLLIECAIFILGIISTGILIKRFFSQKQCLRDGVFGVEVSSSDGYATYPVSSSAAVRGFFRPTVIVFLCICVFQILLLIFFSAVMFA
ncbi:MAG: CPBP family intramembrane metalloprotease [Clostridia bacterium]|nr:CPBP family intramembrane metalloprotease [Clostridia bacterium]